MCLIRDVTQTRNMASDNTEKYKQSSTTFTSKWMQRVAKHPQQVKTWENKTYWADVSTKPKNNPHSGTSVLPVQNGDI